MTGILNQDIMYHWEYVLFHLNPKYARAHEISLSTLQKLAVELRKAMQIVDDRLHIEGVHVLKEVDNDTSPPMGLTVKETESWHKGDMAGIRAALMAHDRQITNIVKEMEVLKAWYSEHRI